MSGTAVDGVRSVTVSWHDPATGLAQPPTVDGLTFMRRIAVQSGEVPHPPFAQHIDMHLIDVAEGRVVFREDPDESHLNPLGIVHGGYTCTVLDSAPGCAAHTRLPAGTGYTSIDIAVDCMRAVTPASGPLTCTGRVVKPGRLVVFAETELTDEAGRTLTTARGKLLLFPLYVVRVRPSWSCSSARPVLHVRLFIETLRERPCDVGVVDGLCEVVPVLVVLVPQLLRDSGPLVE